MARHVIRRQRQTGAGPVPIRVVALLLLVALVAAACGGDGDEGGDSGEATGDGGGATETAAGGGGGDVLIGLITKTDTNPFFVKMREGAEQAAQEAGAELQSFAGEFDGDNETQVEAIETLIQAGADGILITPSDTSAIVPAIEQARNEDILVIALDTPTDPEDAVDAVFATDNQQAGVLIGEYAKALFEQEDREAVIALLDLQEGITVGDLRRTGFLEGFGIEADSDQIVGSEFTQGDQEQGRTAMENLLQRDPSINLVYTINEPAARGAQQALEAAGTADSTTVVSIDGSCPGVEDVASGDLAATSMQFPLRMASLGVEAVVEFTESGEKPSGFTDTGVQLITDNPIDGIESEGVEFGRENCWG